MFRRSAALVAGSLALGIGISGCSLLETGGGTEPLTGVAACALGNTWQLDPADLAPQVEAEFRRRGVPAAVEFTGTQTLDWNEVGHVRLTSDLVLDVFVQVTGDYAISITQPHTGTVTGAAYITGEVAIPRRWDVSELTIETFPEANGTPIEESPWAIPTIMIDDSVGLELTCDGDALTIHPRGGNITQLWTRIGESTI